MMNIRSMKEYTRNRQITLLKDAPVLHVPLPTNFGHSPKPVVKAGDKINKYQLIGQDADGFPAKVHAPVSGIISEIKERLQADGSNALVITIENDYLDTISEENYFSDTKDIQKIIEDAGIVGMGGAQFPTAIKYDLNGKDTDTFIINGAECEPYLTADYAIMSQKAAELFEGIYLANKVIKAKDVIIGIEHENKGLVDIFEPYLKNEKYKNYKVEIVPDEYPQGGELQLTKTLTGIEIPNDKITTDYGIVMSNVNTIYAIYEAVVKQKPLIDRVITVTGENSDEYGNYSVKIGTPVKHILETLGFIGKNPMVIMGGPMMGKYIYDLNTPIHKGAGGLLLLNRMDFKRLPCIGCGYCVDVCPMKLMPMKYEEHYRKKNYRKLEKYNIDDCIDCGSCEYICPCNVPLLESIHEGKLKLKTLKNDIK